MLTQLVFARTYIHTMYTRYAPHKLCNSWIVNKSALGGFCKNVHEVFEMVLYNFVVQR